MNFREQFIAANDDESPPELLANLAVSSDEIIRGAVALNKKTPSRVLAILHKDASEHVQECLRLRKD